MKAAWYCQRDQREYGPLSAQDLVALARDGRLLPTDFVRNGTQGKWTPAANVKGLSFPPARPPTPVVTSASFHPSSQPNAQAKPRSILTYVIGGILLIGCGVPVLVITSGLVFGLLLPMANRGQSSFETESVIEGFGTGWVIAPQYIITNNHVVDGADSVMIRIGSESNRRDLPATVIARQSRPDLAILRCNAIDSPPLPVDEVQKGRSTAIMTLGYPIADLLGDSLKTTHGVISSLPSPDTDGMYLYDAVINPGNSGGPVFDSRGNVVAVTTLVTNTRGQYAGGIPAVDVLRFARDQIPYFKSAPLNSEVADWPSIDKKVSPSTVLVLRMVKH